MGRVVVCTNITLDGVMQAPGRPDEDPRGGFTHGGWGAPYGAMAHAGQVFGQAGALLLGRRTYLDFAEVWPKRVDSPFTPWLNMTPKYVVSRTLAEPLPWANSILVNDDVASAVPRLKREMAKDALVLGSGELIRSLMAHDLVDEYVLLIHPLVLGSGRRLFADGATHSALRLVSSSTAPNGVIVATYRTP
ncbi:MAG: dihydrofolate reductase family protein [Gemmatimonadaceae bacterium]